jgi:SAM-dependent methyltransferase
VTTPLAVYGAALRTAARGEPLSVHVLDDGGIPLGPLNATAWVGGLIPGDQGLLRRCTGATLDVGCGPGRLVAALHHAGSQALGLDISPEAVRQARRRGAPALCGSVFAPLPAEGQWTTILLADGNIGIDGDPDRLLRRCARLLRRGGTVLAEVAPHGAPNWRGHAVLRDAQRQSSPFPWATVPADRIAALARRAGLRCVQLWTEEGRWFAELASYANIPERST